MKKLLFFALILFLPTGIFPGCKKDKGNPPVLPPQESMTIDFSNFSTGKKSGDIVFGQKGIDDINFQFAALVIKAWNDRISLGLLVPVAAFKLAADQNPAYLDTKTWQWSYNVTVAGVVYKARLTGQTGATDIVWKMYITNTASGGFTDFLWFEGTSKSDGTGGQWTIYQSGTSLAVLLKIDWTKTGTSIGTVKYTYMKNGDAFNTSTIEYGTMTGLLNAYYNVHYFNSVEFSDVNIEWSTSIHNGRVKCPQFLLGDWYCWNASKLNDVCQ